MCEVQAGQQNGATQYFTAVLKEEGPAVVGKGMGEVMRYPNVQLEHVIFYE